MAESSIRTSCTIKFPLLPTTRSTADTTHAHTHTHTQCLNSLTLCTNSRSETTTQYQVTKAAVTTSNKHAYQQQLQQLFNGPLPRQSGWASTVSGWSSTGNALSGGLTPEMHCLRFMHQFLYHITDQYPRSSSSHGKSTISLQETASVTLTCSNWLGRVGVF